MRTALDWADGLGLDAVVVGLGDQPVVETDAWRRGRGRRRRASRSRSPCTPAERGNPVRLDRAVWPLLAATGDAGARRLMADRPELVGEIRCQGAARRHRHAGGSRAMELTNDFRVGVPVAQAWDVLTDVERIAPCMPGAQLEEVDGDEYRGVVKVKVGPITAAYKGVARFIELDAEAHRAVLRAEGRETRGPGQRQRHHHGHADRRRRRHACAGPHRADRHRSGGAVRPGRDGRRLVEAPRPVRGVPRGDRARGRPTGSHPGRRARARAGRRAPAAAGPPRPPCPPRPTRLPPRWRAWRRHQQSRCAASNRGRPHRSTWSAPRAAPSPSEWLGRSWRVVALGWLVRVLLKRRRG